MASLPPGWEWDYDGSRWLYRYIPTGHAQYRFPTAGDEFPDYVDAAAPPPDMAPEERLEVKRRQAMMRELDMLGNRAKEEKKKEERENGWEGRMSARAQPVSFVWEPEKEVEQARGDVFQPESFMFLGPGVYMDVSPLVEEEEEAAKRTVVGIEEQMGVSPVASARSTPLVPKREVEMTLLEEEEEGEEDEREALREAQTEADGGRGEIGFDVFELPGELGVFDPVGVIAEMATEQTAAARVETHPEPVEMADTSVELGMGVPRGRRGEHQRGRMAQAQRDAAEGHECTAPLTSRANSLQRVSRTQLDAVPELLPQVDTMKSQRIAEHDQTPGDGPRFPSVLKGRKTHASGMPSQGQQEKIPAKAFRYPSVPRPVPKKPGDKPPPHLLDETAQISQRRRQAGHHARSMDYSGLVAANFASRPARGPQIISVHRRATSEKMPPSRMEVPMPLESSGSVGGPAIAPTPGVTESTESRGSLYPPPLVPNRCEGPLSGQHDAGQVGHCEQSMGLRRSRSLRYTEEQREEPVRQREPVQGQDRKRPTSPGGRERGERSLSSVSGERPPAPECREQEAAQARRPASLEELMDSLCVDRDDLVPEQTTNQRSDEMGVHVLNKWATRPVVDYSGDDWGGDF